MTAPQSCRSLSKQSFFRQDELAKGYTGASIHTNEIGNATHTCIMLYVHNSTPASRFGYAIACTVSLAKDTDKNSQQATHLSLNLFIYSQQQARVALKLREKSLKARFSDLQFRNLHMNCYQFCKQCENHFETGRVKRSNRIFFVTLFLPRKITQQ